MADQFSGNIQPSLDLDEHAHIGVPGGEGAGAKRTQIAPMAIKLIESGSIKYLAMAAPGSQDTDAVWQARKIDTTSGVVITWADGDSNFNNQANNLASLTYS